MNRFTMVINRIENLHLELEAAKKHDQELLAKHPDHKNAYLWVGFIGDYIAEMENCREAIEILKKHGGEG